MFFDLCGQMHIASILQKHTGMGDSEDFLHLMIAGGDMDQIRMSVKLSGNGNAVFYVIASIIAFRAAYADFHGETGPAGFVNTVYDGEQQSASVFNVRSAPFVRSGVGDGGQELVQHPSVSGMYQNHAEAAFLCEKSSVYVFLDGAFNDFLCHRADLSARTFTLHRAVGYAFGLRTEKGQVTVGEHAGMLQF